MAVRAIAKMGNPVLRQKARELTREEILSEPIRALVRDMVETLHAVGGIGLAAPQVEESLRLAIIEIAAGNDRYPSMKEQELLVLFNPKVTVLDAATQEFWEGCLSVPELRGLVARPRKIRVDYLDSEGKPHAIEAEGFLATVFQHELDHLDGTLYVDKLVSTKQLMFLDEFRKFAAGSPPVAD